MRQQSLLNNSSSIITCEIVVFELSKMLIQWVFQPVAYDIDKSVKYESSLIDRQTLSGYHRFVIKWI
jgi:hypothetical protein